MIAPDDFDAFVRWTTPAEARAIREEQATIDELNEWERSRWSVRVLVLIRDLAILGLVGAAWVAACLVWGRP